MDTKAVIALALAGVALVVTIISLATDYWAESNGVVRRSQCILFILVFLLIFQNGYSHLFLFMPDY